MGISREQALDCFCSDDLVGIGMEADAVRRRLHPEGVVSYAVGANADFTEVLRAAKDNADAESRLDRMCSAISAAVAAGASGVRLTGAIRVKSEVGLQWVEGMLREMRRLFPTTWLEGMAAAEISTIAAGCSLEVRDLLERLREAGLDAIAGDCGGLHANGVETWVGVQRAAHGLGMAPVARMIFGAGETVDERVSFLEAVRRLQEETGGFAAFAPVAASAPNGRELDGVTAVERLKTLAVGRMFLDNIVNLEAAEAGEGLKVLQTEMRFGANDAGWVAPEGSREEDVRLVIRDAGFRPAQRDAAYRVRMLG